MMSCRALPAIHAPSIGEAMATYSAAMRTRHTSGTSSSSITVASAARPRARYRMCCTTSAMTIAATVRIAATVMATM